MLKRIIIIGEYIPFHAVYEVGLLYFDWRIINLMRIQFISFNEGDGNSTISGGSRSCIMIVIGSGVPKVWVRCLHDLTRLINIGNSLDDFLGNG
jgi:hypothetical protein